MQTISLKADQKAAVEQAAQVLRQGGVVVIPTETSYGLSCDPRNLAALGKIYRIKGRDASKALPLVACSVEQVKELFNIPQAVEVLVAKYWPGPLTVLLEPKDMNLRRSLPVFKDGLAAIRVSSHPFVQQLTREYGFPLTATSANMSNDKPCFSSAEVSRVFEALDKSRQPDVLIDGGELPVSEPSTIVKVDQSGKIEVIRQGAISI